MVAVLPQASTGWRVELNDGQEGLLFSDKRQALDFALGWAEAHQPAELRVYGRFGEIDRSIVYPDGDFRRLPRADRRHKQFAIGFFDRRQRERRAPA